MEKSIHDIQLRTAKFMLSQSSLSPKKRRDIGIQISSSPINKNSNYYLSILQDKKKKIKHLKQTIIELQERLIKMDQAQYSE